MTKDQVKHMVDRFLGWRLPKPWNPDNGISYQRPNYAHSPADHDWPTGTNLFDADQAAAMVHYMVEEIPGDDDEFGWVIERGDSSPAAPTYWSGPEYWSQDHMDAVRFARKQDAERVACRLHGGYHRVCEHGWHKSPASPERRVQCDACGEMKPRDEIAKVTAYGIETSACAKRRGDE